MQPATTGMVNGCCSRGREKKQGDLRAIQLDPVSLGNIEGIRGIFHCITGNMKPLLIWQWWHWSLDQTFSGIVFSLAYLGVQKVWRAIAIILVEEENLPRGKVKADVAYLPWFMLFTGRKEEAGKIIIRRRKGQGLAANDNHRYGTY